VLGGDGKGGLDLGRDMIANDAKEGGNRRFHAAQKKKIPIL
jgi:hypothetical protein